MADNVNLKLLFGTEANFTDSTKAPTNIKGNIYFTTVDANRSYLYFGDGSNFLNIVPKLLTVANGGTGRSTLTSGRALIGNGTGAVSLRSITNNTTVTYIGDNINLITAKTLKNWNGSYDNKGTSNIQYVGTIAGGTWCGSVIAVPYGGTGKDSLTANGILYGAGINAVGVTAAGTDGQILTSEEGTPKFLTPTVSWVAAASSTNGPVVQFELSKQKYISELPAASTTASGAMTFGDQSFAGIKTFTSGTKTSNIYPRSNNTYTSGAEDYNWSIVYSKDYDVRDPNKVRVGHFYSSTTGTASTTGIATLSIGNGTTSGTAGNAQGYLYIYGSNKGYSLFKSAATTSNYTITIPATSGNMLISSDATTNPTSATTYYVPFYTTDYKKVSMNDGLRVTSLEGTASALGYSILVLGNATAGGKAKNKYGAIRLYSSTSTYNDIKAHPDTSTFSIQLPKLSAAAEFVYHDVNTSVGSTDQPVYIDVEGKAMAITTMAVGYGGTGATTFTANGVLYGAGTSAIKVTSAGTQGQILSPNSSGTPGFASPSWTWTNGSTSGPTLTLKLQNKSWTTAAIPSATATTSGIVTTGAQSFSGVKTFENTSDSSATDKGSIVTKGGVGIALQLRVGGATTLGSTVSVGNTMTFTNGTAANNKITTSSGAMYYSSASTLYLTSGSGSSIIISPQGTEQARFNTSGKLVLKSGASKAATLNGPNTADGTFYFPNTGGTFVTHETRGTAVGGTTTPVYIASTGRATACTKPKSRAWFSAIPSVDGGGVLDIGRYIDFHYTADSANDYDVRIDCAGNSKNTLYLPAVSGQVVVHTNDTAIGGSTVPVYIAASGAATTCSTYAGGTKVTLNGSSKSGSTASFYAPTAAGTSGQLLVSSGGAPTWKSLADIADSRYVNVSGDTMTGTLKIKSGDAGNYTEGIRIAPANNGWTSLILGSSADSGTGTGAWSLHTYNNNFYLSHNGSSNGSPMITGIPNDGFNISGTLNLANGTWNKAGDDAYFGDNNTAGSFAIKGQNGYTNLKLVSNRADSCGYITYNQDQKCIKFSFG